MHIENLEQFLPESYVFLFVIIVFITYWTIKSIKNYFLAIKDAYADSNSLSGKVMKKFNYVTISMLVLLPYLISLILITYPFGFRVNKAGAEITGFSWNISIIKIPSKIFIWDVTSIGEEAFKNQTNLEKITIPTSVSSIGRSAFEGCVNLKQLEIPDSITVINESAFKNCSSLIKVEYSENIEVIGPCAFLNCTNLLDTYIPKEALGAGAYYNTLWFNEQIGDFIILDNEHYIYLGDEAIVTVPDGIKTVDFYNADTVEVILLPETYEENEYSFDECSNLRYIEIRT